MKSPCRRICKIIPGTELCAGCFRTRYEIQVWTNLTDEQKEGINKRVAPSIEMKILLNKIMKCYDEKLFTGEFKNLMDDAAKYKEEL